MKKRLHSLPAGIITLFCLLFSQHLLAQTLEWRLGNVVYNPTDPDGDGDAKGSVTFTLQIHTVSGTVSNVGVISTGWSYQSSQAMVPTGTAGPGCTVVNTPANVVISPAFAAAKYAFNTVNQCSDVNPAQQSGGQEFDRRAVGTLEGDPINITTDWLDVFTVTLWSLNASEPNAGFAIINSGEGGSPEPFNTYIVAAGDEGFVVNSLSYSTPVLLPISLSKFAVACNGNGAKLNWSTLSEQNSKTFEVERSDNAVNGWTTVGISAAFGNSNDNKEYSFVDLKGGSAFYRLKQIDKDGTFTYSAIEKANCITKKTDLLVYPIPAKNVLNVVIGADKNAKAMIYLVDVTGKTIRQMRTDLLKGTNNLKFNVAGLATGEYFLRVAGSEVLKTQKVTIAP